jgi:tetratricopeptide (TPR) repeat protein
MFCAHCGAETQSGEGRCAACGRPLPELAGVAPDAGAFATVSRGAPVSPADLPTIAPLSPGLHPDPGLSAAALAPGQAFGTRYHIIRELGRGGMGIVYQAWDDELGVAVALKTIRPDTSGDPEAARERELRFKRELVLARQVTHKHVVRIHDLGEINGVKYLTMPFIQGETLGARIRREGHLPVARALHFAKQIVAGLAAAHDEGVVHRDLKPANIMIDSEGEIVILDFGLARSVSGMTVGTATGTLMGTVEYMAPEQASGSRVDQRADIYALGLIVHEMLVGRRHSSDTALGELMLRTREAPPSVRSLDPQIPEAIDRIVARCLRPDPAERYQTSAELAADLDRLDVEGFSLVERAEVRPRRAWLVPALAVLCLAAVATAVSLFLWGGRAPSAPVARAPVSVLIADFDNKAGDPVFDGLIEQALSVGIEGASFISAYPRRDALRLASQLSPAGKLTEDLARTISLREGIDIVVSGEIAQTAQKYQLTVKAIDPAQGKFLLTWDTDASAKDQVLTAVGKAATKVRNALGDATADLSHFNNAETFTAGSLEAAHAYANAQELQWAGKFEEAIAQYEQAVKLDPELGRAYSGLAALYNNLGRRDEAERYYQTALSKIDRMTDREKYRTRGAYYLFTRNSTKAIEELQALVDKYPADTSGLGNLAVAHFNRRDMKRAVELGQRAVAVYPKNVIRRNNVALFAMYAGDFAAAGREANEALKINPKFEKAFVAIALSKLAQDKVAEAGDTYRKLEPVSKAGRSFATSGLADLAVYEGRLADAERILESAIAAALSDGNNADAARWLAMLGGVRLERRETRPAIEAADRATSLSTDPGDLFLTGRIYLEADRASKALRLASALGAGLEDDPQIYAKLLQGEVALKQGKARDALQRFQEAQQISDSWLGRFDKGRAYLQAGAFTEAYSEFDTCQKRRGEATAVFLDDVPSYRFFAPVYYYLGRAQEGLKSPAAAQSYKTFLAIKEHGDEQEIVADARRRLGIR